MKLSDICETIHGELPYIGQPCMLIRLSGCNLKCKYCDTDYSLKFEKTPIQVSEYIKNTKLYSVLITGGEPLLQQSEVFELVEALRTDIHIIIETNGSLPLPDIECFYPNITWVMDFKLTGEGGAVNIGNFKVLRALDVVKFVFFDDESFDKSIDIFRSYYPECTRELYWVWSPTEEMILRKKCGGFVERIVELQKELKTNRVRFQYQIHKILGIK